MTETLPDPRYQRLQELRREVAALELQLREPSTPWQAQGYYPAYDAISGAVLGMIGAAASLLFNVVGSAVIGQNPLRLIQVYLTFPLGARALTSEFDSGMVLALGCCLYLATGMLLGIPFQLVLARFMPKGSLGQRLLLATAAGLVLWAVNFYLILSWLQPAVCGGAWITDPKVLPPWVGAATHLVFAWTMAWIYPWGVYVPYRRQTETADSPTASGISTRPG